MININKEKAVELVKDRLRAEREPRLAILDIEFMRALENGDPTGDIVRDRQALRDVTNKPLADLSIDQLAILALDDALAL